MVFGSLARQPHSERQLSSALWRDLEFSVDEFEPLRHPRFAYRRQRRQIGRIACAICCAASTLGCAICWRVFASHSATASSIGAAVSDAEAALTAQNVVEGARPTLFCWCHINLDSYHEKLMRVQYSRRVGIFACNDFAVMSSAKKVIAGEDGEQVETWFNPDFVDASFMHTTKTVITAWSILWKSGKIWAVDFVVKVDPETVFFPYRLREMAHLYVSKKVYFPNCGDFSDPGGPQLLGTMEVFSIPAMKEFIMRQQECTWMPCMDLGEHEFMKRCMDHIGVSQTLVLQVSDPGCKNIPCSNASYVAYGGYNTTHKWLQCFDDSRTTTSTTTSTVTNTTTSTTTSTTSTTTTMPLGPRPWLFCWSHMEFGDYEEALIREQLHARASIFACNDFAVIGPRRGTIGHIDGTPIKTWFNPETKVGMGTYGMNGQKTDSFLNTKTFIDSWDTLMNSGHLWAFDFVVKVDPDAVFFASRLRPRVKHLIGKSVYFPNCGKWLSGPKLYGSIEVFSVPALQQYHARRNECLNLPWQGWGEDYYMQHCMDLLGAQMENDFQQVGDDRCIGAPCSDETKVAFHPFKNVTSWFQCYHASQTTTTYSRTSTTRTESTTTLTTATSTTGTALMTTLTTATVSASATSAVLVATPSERDERPALFCWSHMQAESYEVDLIRLQLSNRANIFACNGFAVVSNTRAVIGHSGGAAVETVYIQKGQVDGEQTESFLNTNTLLAAWDAVIKSGLIRLYDFIIKVEPDVVFFPDRIRERLLPYVGQTVYVANCGRWPSGPRLSNSVQVFAVSAIDRYAGRAAECQLLPWQSWDEDSYMQSCMVRLGVLQVTDFAQVGDHRCGPAPCSDRTRVAFHDFKTIGSWMHCFETAVGAK